MLRRDVRRLFQFAIITFAAVFQCATADAHLNIQASSATLLGGAASDNYGGNSYSQTSLNANSNLSFDLNFAGYQNSSTFSAGQAQWTSTGSGLSLTDSATQTVSPTPSFTQYFSDAQYRFSWVVNFTVSEDSVFTVTSSQGSLGSSSVIIRDGSQEIYTWFSGSVLPGASPIALLTGHAYSLDYNAAFQTLGSFRNSTFTDTYEGSFALVSSVPEPETYPMLLAGLGLLGFAARRRKQKTA